MVQDVRPQYQGPRQPLGVAEPAVIMAHPRLTPSSEVLETPATVQQLEISPPVVLVADDEAQIVDLLCLLLEDEGFQVLRAYDGLQAWRLFQTARPDLIISDVMMPGLSGIELTRRVKRRGSATPPMILMSAVAEPNPPANTPFLAKPFDINHLLDLVMQLTERRAQI